VRIECVERCGADLADCLGEADGAKRDLCEGSNGICKHSCETEAEICEYNEAGALDEGVLRDLGDITRGPFPDFGYPDARGVEVRLDSGRIREPLPRPDFGI